MLAFVHKLKATENLSAFLNNAEEKESENTKYAIYSLPLPHLVKKFSYFIYSS